MRAAQLQNLIGSFGSSGNAPVTEIFTASTTWHSPVGGVVGGVAHVQVWGGGGGGETSAGLTLGGSGAGGGGYSEELAFAIAADTLYTVTVGAEVDKDVSGESSEFEGSISANGGSRGRPASAGEGGAGNTHTGGDGGDITASAAGSGGGGAAGTESDGSAGSPGALDVAGSGGQGGPGGGAGGNGADDQISTPAQDGTAPGGGGGGGSVSQVDGGGGARGEVRITYTPL